MGGESGNSAAQQWPDRSFCLPGLHMPLKGFTMPDSIAVLALLLIAFVLLQVALEASRRILAEADLVVPGHGEPFRTGRTPG
jgi:hypothetical protein